MGVLFHLFFKNIRFCEASGFVKYLHKENLRIPYNNRTAYSIYKYKATVCYKIFSDCLQPIKRLLGHSKNTTVTFYGTSSKVQGVDKKIHA